MASYFTNPTDSLEHNGKEVGILKRGDSQTTVNEKLAAEIETLRGLVNTKNVSVNTPTTTTIINDSGFGSDKSEVDSGERLLVKVEPKDDSIYVSYFPSGATLTVSLAHGNVADRFIVDYNNVTIIDTTYLGNSGFTCPSGNIPPLPILNVSAIPNGDNIVTDITGAGGIVDASITCVRKEAIYTQFTYTTSAEGELVISHNSPQCANQGVWQYHVTCSGSTTCNP